MRLKIAILFLMLACVAFAGSKKQSMRKFSVFANASTSPYWTSPDTALVRYDFETTNSTQTLDTSGNGLHASNVPSVVNGPVWFIAGTNSQGRIDYAYDFDGSDDAFGTANSSLLQLTTGVTVMAWVRPVSIGAFEKIVAKWRDSGSGSAYVLQVNTGGEIHFDLDTGGVTRLNAGTGKVTTGTWQHIVGTWDGSTMKIYKNGVEIASRSETNALSCDTSRLAVGCRWDPSLGYRLFFDGDIDQVKVFDYGVSSNGVYNFYQYTSPLDNMEAR